MKKKDCTDRSRNQCSVVTKSCDYVTHNRVYLSVEYCSSRRKYEFFLFLIKRSCWKENFCFLDIEVWPVIEQKIKSCRISSDNTSVCQEIIKTAKETRLSFSFIEDCRSDCGCQFLALFLTKKTSKKCAKIICHEIHHLDELSFERNPLRVTVNRSR